MAQGLKWLTALAGAPCSTTAVLTEMNAMTEALKHLSDYLNGHSNVPAGCEQLVLLEYVAVTQWECVGTSSELVAIISNVHSDAEKGAIDHPKWTLSETVLCDIIQQIRNHKTCFAFKLRSNDIAMVRHNFRCEGCVHNH